MFRSQIIAGILSAYGFLAWATGTMAEEPKPGLAYELFGDANLQRLAESGSVAEIGPMDKGSSDWSLRFTGMLTPPTDGDYVFRAEADTGVRVKINQKLVIDGWARGAARNGKATLEKGKPVPLVVEYFFDRPKGGAKAALRLFWTPPGAQEAPVPAGAIKAPTATPAPAAPAKPAAPLVPPPAATPPSPARPEASGISIRVEQPSKTESEGGKKTVTRALKIFVSNNSTQPVELKVKYVLFGRDAADKDIKPIAEGDRPASVKPRSTETVETNTATAVMTAAKHDKGKRIPAAGMKFVGYGVKVFLGDRLVAESYDPPSIKASWGQAPAAGKRAGKVGGLGL